MNPQYLTSQSFPALTAFPALSLDYFYNQIFGFPARTDLFIFLEISYRQFDFSRKIS